jgi:hypothetical protein
MILLEKKGEPSFAPTRDILITFTGMVHKCILNSHHKEGDPDSDLPGRSGGGPLIPLPGDDRLFEKAATPDSWREVTYLQENIAHHQYNLIKLTSRVRTYIFSRFLPSPIGLW